MAITPRTPEVGQSPLLSKKVVDKPIVDPLLQNDQQPQPQPQQTQQQQQQQQPIQPPQPQQYHDPSMDSLTQPQIPLNDPNLRSMTFDDMVPPPGEEREYGGSSSGGGGGSNEKDQSTIKIPTAEAKAFSELIIGLSSAYIPMICAKIACVNVKEHRIE
jgi:hypothetical protein